MADEYETLQMQFLEYGLGGDAFTPKTHCEPQRRWYDWDRYTQRDPSNWRFRTGV